MTIYLKNDQYEPSELVGEFVVPIRTVSEANQREFPYLKRRRKRAQKLWIASGFPKHLKDYKKKVFVRLVRIAPREMDTDNLVSSFKNIADGIAELLYPGLAPGRADKGITFSWSQCKGKPKEYAVFVQIYDAKEINIK